MSSKSSTGQSPVVKLAALGILAIGFFYLSEGVSHLSQRIMDLPVQGRSQEAAAPTVEPSAQAAGPVSRTMHPLLVESNQKAAALRKQGVVGAANLDALFGREQAQKELDELQKKAAEQEKKAADASKALSTPAIPAAVAALPVIDHFRLLTQKVRIQAVMTDGAVVNGGFYSLGDEVKTLGYLSADGKKVLYPTLESVSEETVLLTEADGGDRKIKAKLAH